MSDTPPPAVNPLPPAVIVLFLAVVIGEAYIAGAEAQLWGQFDARVGLIRQFAFFPEGFERALAAGIWQPELFWRMLTYPFVHAAIMQSILASVLILALGKFVGEILGNTAVFAIFGISSVCAALGYAQFTSSTYPLFGGYPPAYGLIGGFSFVLFSRAEGLLSHQLRAFRMLGLLMAINISFSLFSSGPPSVGRRALRRCGRVYLSRFDPAGRACQSCREVSASLINRCGVSFGAIRQS
jgi:membrane associated rhomboid family serine protease